MKRFLAIYTGFGTSEHKKQWDAMSEEERYAIEQKAMVAWGRWMEEHKDAVVDAGGPLSKTKLVNRDGVSDSQNNMSAYIIVTADSRDVAAKIFENHPHFALFPGDGVEVMEIMPMPGL